VTVRAVVERRRRREFSGRHGVDLINCGYGCRPEERRTIAQKAGQARWAKEETSAAATVGRKGGKARAKKLSAGQRKEIAQKAAQARWAKQEGSGS
jgi:hypothetical protein